MRAIVGKNLIRKESADVVIVIESLERKKTYLSSIQIFSSHHRMHVFVEDDNEILP